MKDWRDILNVLTLVLSLTAALFLGTILHKLSAHDARLGVLERAPVKTVRTRPAVSPYSRAFGARLQRDTARHRQNTQTAP